MEIVNQIRVVPEQQKSYYAGRNLGGGSFYEHLLTSYNFDLAAHVALKYYATTAPLYTASDMITQELGSITVVCYDEQTQQFVDHPVLQLLNNPNPYQTGKELLEEMATYYLIAGNEYMIATGGVDRPPLELYTANPSRINIEASQEDGYPINYNLACAGRSSETFKRMEANRRVRYVNREELADQELFHLKTIDPSTNCQHKFGMSKLNPVMPELEQYNQSSIHNLMLLKNGARVTGILHSENSLTDEQFQRLQSELNNYYSGAQNAGRPMIAEGDLKFTEAGQSNRDMDFMDLKKDVRDSIYNIMRIPLPLISRDEMTLANMETATLMLYDGAVIPLFKKMMTHIGQSLIPRYRGQDDPNRYRLTFIEQDIPALKTRYIASTKQLSELNAYSTNEIRTMLGNGEIENGNDVLVPMNLVPLGTDLDTSDQSPNDDESPRRKRIEIFKLTLRSKLDTDGKRIYNDDQIDALVKEHFED